MKTEPLDTHSKLLQIQSRLSKFAYLSKEALPGSADALIFQKLKSSQKMPTKQKYFNFHHWYNMMSQFAIKQMQKWIENKQKQQDKLITQCLTLINNLKNNSNKTNDHPIDYIMSIFLKEPIQINTTNIKNKLKSINHTQIGQNIKITYKPYQQRSKELIQPNNQIRIIFKITPKACQILKDLISKSKEVQNIQIKKQMKQKNI